MGDRHEQRRSRRFGWEKHGYLRFSGAADQICVIRDISQHGARIALPIGTPLPQSFELLVRPGAAPRACKMVWRTSAEVGVEFLNDTRAAELVNLEC